MKSDMSASHELGSYRDPDSFVFYEEGRVCRALSQDSRTVLNQAWQKGALRNLVDKGVIVGSRMLAEESDEYARLSSRFPGWRGFMVHDKIPMISYPYEWCFSMLADAAAIHLEIQQALLNQGFSLKDASAFNVQFTAAKPVFIDLGSVEIPARLDVWIAYSQFCRMFLFPLLLYMHRGLGFRETLIANIEGPSVEQVVKVFGRFRSMRPDMFLDVFLQHLFGARGKQQARALRAELQNKGGNSDVQKMNLGRLARKIEKLRSHHCTSGHWVGYATDNTYADTARVVKESFVREFLQTCKPDSVLDLGCNTGEYSIMCAQSGARVVAVDSDIDCVEMLYQRAKKEKLDILPLVMDLANPSPGLGFMNSERRSFLDRAPCDAVMALALVHHLLITARLPLSAICCLMASVAKRYLVIEFVEREDEMFQTLLALRKDLYGEITIEGFLAAFDKSFALVRRAAIPGTRRHLFLFERKGS